MRENIQKFCAGLFSLLQDSASLLASSSARSYNMVYAVRKDIKEYILEFKIMWIP